MSLSIRHVVAAVDVDVMGDANVAGEVVDAAIDVALRFEARITLLHVAAPVPLMADDPNIGSAQRAALDILEARTTAARRALDDLKRLAETEGVRCDVDLVTDGGRVAETIATRARAREADLLVLATHARRGLDRVLLGSVAERVAHLSHVPVLLLPPKPHPKGKAIL